MSKYLIISLSIVTLLLIGSGLALKRQLEVNGEQRQAIKEREAALTQALEQKKAAEAAVGVRDEKLTQIKSENRRLNHALKEAIANAECSGKPVPDELDRLLHDRAPETSQGLSSEHAYPRA
jgi:c-di-GMP-related signal transduction protein